MSYFQFFVVYSIGALLTVFAALYGYYIFHGIKAFRFFAFRKFSFWTLLFFTLLWVITFALMKDLSVLSHHSYFDFAVFLEYFENFALGKGLVSNIQGNAIPGNSHWFSNHFTPLSYLFAVAYKIWPSFHTVNWLQTILLATSPVILFLLSRRFLGVFGAFCISFALLLNPTFQYITLYEFEYLRFIIPLGILALGITLGGYPILFVFLSSFAVLLIREDAALMVFGLGVFIFLFQKKRRLAGLAIMAMSIIYFLVVLEVIMPFFREPGGNLHVAIGSFQTFGKTLPEILKNILLNPVNFLIYFFHPFKTFNWVMLVLPFSFLSIAGANVLVILLPTLMFLSFSDSVTHSSYFFYYVAPVLPVVAWSAVVGIPRMEMYLSNKERLVKWVHRCPPSVERISFAVLMGSLVCSIYFGPSPISIQYWSKGFVLAPFRTNTFYVDRYRPTSHDEIVRKVATLVPKVASVSIEQFLAVDVFRSKNIKVFPVIENVDYIFIDKANPLKTGIGNVPGSWIGLRKNPQFYYNWVEKRPDIFELVYSEDGVFLYKRKPGAPPYPQPCGTP